MLAKTMLQRLLYIVLRTVSDHSSFSNWPHFAYAALVFSDTYYTWKSLFTISEFSLFGHVLFLLEKFVCGLFYRGLYIGQDTEN